MKHNDAEIFTENERQKLEKIFNKDEENLLLAIKTIVYLFKRLLKFIFMPSNLKNDLNKIGLNNEKADIIAKVWSAETKATLEELSSEDIVQNRDSPNFSWKLNAELSSDYRKKCKVPKAYMSFPDQNDQTVIELTHPELYSMFLQFEAVQNELDYII